MAEGLSEEQDFYLNAGVDIVSGRWTNAQLSIDELIEIGHDQWRGPIGNNAALRRIEAEHPEFERRPPRKRK